MGEVRLWITCAMIAVGLLCVGLGIPLLRRRVKPNRLYGLRTMATFADDWVWYEANAASGRDLIGLGVVGILLAMATASIPNLEPAAHALANVAFWSIATLGVALTGWARANRLLKERRSQARCER